MPRLANANPPIAREILELLPYSTAELFLSDHCTNNARTQENDLTAHARQQLESYLTTHLAPKPLLGLQLYDQVCSQLRVIPTGCESLDALLGNGLREGALTELVGESSSGKTQIMLQLAAVTALRDEAVVYFDTTNSFSAQRVLAIARHNAAAAAEFDPVRVLSHILVLRAHSIADVLSLMDQLAVALEARLSTQQQQQQQQQQPQQPLQQNLHQHHQQQQQAQQYHYPPSGVQLPDGSLDPAQQADSAAAALLPLPTPHQAHGGHQQHLPTLPGPAAVNPSLLLLDSVSAVVTPVLGGQQHCQGHALMLSLARMIKQMAERYKLAAVVSNHVVSGDWGSKRPGGQGGGGGSGGGSGGARRSKPALGEHWLNQASFRLQLSQQQGNVRSAERTASPLHALGQEAWFSITDKGVVSVQPARPP